MCSVQSAPILPVGQSGPSQGIDVPTLGSFHRSSWPQAYTFIRKGLGTQIVPEDTRDWLTSLHLASFAKHLFLSSQIHCQLSEFEHLSSLHEMPRYLLSSLYSLIQALTQDDLPPYTRMWSADLGKSLSRADLQTAFHFAHKSSISWYSQEKIFKILSRRSRDPSTLHKIFPSTPASYWRFCAALGVLTSISGGSVKGYDPSGLRYFRCMMLSMRNLYSQPQRLPSSPCCRAP